MPLSYANIYNHVEKTLSPSYLFSLCHHNLSLSLFIFIYNTYSAEHTQPFTSRHDSAITRADIRAFSLFFFLFCHNIVLKCTVASLRRNVVYLGISAKILLCSWRMFMKLCKLLERLNMTKTKKKRSNCLLIWYVLYTYLIFFSRWRVIYSPSIAILFEITQALLF